MSQEVRLPRRPALLAVAHGSRNPAAQQAVGALVERVRRLAPALDVRMAFVQHAEPSLATELAAAGSDVVVVPLLLSTGYHLAVDISGAAAAAGARLAAPLGPHRGLAAALADHLSAAGVPDGAPVVLAATNERATDIVALEVLRQHAVDVPGDVSSLD